MRILQHAGVLQQAADGCAVIEVEDKAFEGSREDILNSIRLSKRYLDNFLI